MNLFIILLLTRVHWSFTIPIENSTSTNKTKRTVVDTYNYEENKPIILYVDNEGAPSSYYSDVKSLPIPNSHLKTVFDNDVPKHVAAQQVLYEYQQTPTNSVSNVHVKQLFQPIPTNQGLKPNNNAGNPSIQNQPPNAPAQAPYITSETVVSPVQHSALINHGHNYAQVQFQPYFGTPHHTQTQHYVPGKYYYVNGKYYYPVGPPQLQSQNYQKPPLQHPANFVSYNHHVGVPEQKLMPPPTPAAQPYNNFIPPQKHAIQTISKPIPKPAEVEEEQNDDEENSNLDENEEINEDDGSHENTQYEDERDEDDDRLSNFRKYFDNEEDEDHEGYNEEQEEEEDDSDKKSSSIYRTKTRKTPKKHSYVTKKLHKPKNKNYKYSESYSSSKNYQHPKEKIRNVRKPVSHNRGNDKYRNSKNSKQKSGRIQAKYSENIPVIVDHKILRQKWYIEKTKDNKFDF